MRTEQSKAATLAGALPAPASARTEAQAYRSRPLRKVLHFARTKPLGAVGGIIVIGLMLTAIFAEQIAPYAYDQGKGSERLQGPSLQHLFGTDNLGRDLFSRIVFGARVSIEVGFGAVLVGTGLAAILGILSGFYGGLFDLLFQRIIDAWIAFPAIVLLACLVTIMTSRATSSTNSI